MQSMQSMQSMLSSLLPQTQGLGLSPATTTNTDPEALLQRQQQTQQQLQALLNQSSAILACGPECQKQQELDRLQTAYVEAEANVQAAPVQLETARRRWVVASKGRAAYDAERAAALQTQAQTLGAQLQAKFDELAAAAETACAAYQLAEAQSRQAAELLGAYQSENQTLGRSAESLAAEATTNDSRVWYETEALRSVRAWTTVWLGLYYLLWLLVAGRLAMRLRASFSWSSSSTQPLGTTATNTNTRSAALTVVGLALAAGYPWFVQPLLAWLYRGWRGFLWLARWQ